MNNLNANTLKKVLDTNAFYEFCYILGLQDFGVKVGINERVDYNSFKKIVEEALQNKSLFIPETTIFEFVCKLRNDEERLKKIIVFLKKVSSDYAYNLSTYNNSILFGFDQYSDEYWKKISIDYKELIKLKDSIVLAKIGSEAEIITMFSRWIIQVFLINYYDKPCYKDIVDIFNRYFFMNPFGDGTYKTVKQSVARKLFDYYKNNEDGKNKKKIFELAVNISAYMLKIFWDFIYESSLKREKETIQAIEGDFASEKSIQTNINKWFNKGKDINSLSKNIKYIIESLKKRCDFNDSQFAYLEKVLIDLFTNGTKMEKNDTEDFWNLGFVKRGDAYLISLDLEIINILKQKNKSNYDYIRKFYNCS